MREVGAREQAIALARITLGESPTVSEDTLRDTVNLIIQFLHASGKGGGLNPSELVRDLEELYNVSVGNETTLFGDSPDHQPWLSSRFDADTWWRWARYRTYLLERKLLSPQSLDRMDHVTHEILGLLEDPERDGPWDRRGLVVGQVQSGKTANYTGLICKAADAGYKLIIVLAGVHDSLRSQTQLRLDEDFIGFDSRMLLESESQGPVGVGLLPGFVGRHSALTLTTSGDKGDFTLGHARKVGVPLGGEMPMLLVVKKNKTILDTLNRWATALPAKMSGKDRRIVSGVPLLVIDDEADHASINTKAIPLDENGQADREIDPTTINRLIRQLLHSFEQSAYVGYTATPFANIFIYQDLDHSRYGPDLFPKSFIINLPTPSNYIGPLQVFGLESSADIEGEHIKGLPIIREIDDYSDWMPDGHKTIHEPGEPPRTLRQAIHSFILSCAIRAARGQEKSHNSMLVHVTRYTKVQDRVADQIEQELLDLRNRLRYGDGNSTVRIIDELRQLWDQDFRPTTATFLSRSVVDPLVVHTNWAEIEPWIKHSIEKIDVIKVNGNAQDALVYKDHPAGLSVIAVGGDKLSRGLTLEGLTVSYYLRASRMYDTLMQMGRWFGYRPGYADLCRLYTTEELVDWYRDITAASEELRAEFDHMASLNATPEDFGLRVRTHPAGLMVTAANKMRTGTKLKVSFSATVSETVAFHRTAEVIQTNFRSAEILIEELSGESRRKPDSNLGSLVWMHQRPDPVLQFLNGYHIHPGARRVIPGLLSQYIRQRNAENELTDWTVVLVSNSLATSKPHEIAKCTVGLIVRTAVNPESQALSDGEPYRIRRLLSPTDESIGLTVEELKKASIHTRDNGTKGAQSRDGRVLSLSGPAVRGARHASKGLLLIYPLDPERAGLDSEGTPIIGFGISFPRSERAVELEYVVNSTYWDQEFAEL